MNGRRYTRIQAAIIGCGIAIVSCLISLALHREKAHPAVIGLPARLGEWVLLQQQRVDDDELKILRADDHWRRVYQSSDSQTCVVVTLVAGPSGPLASHQPEVCYARNAFTPQGDALVWIVPQHSDTFRFQTLEPRLFDQPAITIAYAWYDGRHWRAPWMPRLQLAGNANLQRLQLSIQHPCGMSREALSALQRFVQLVVDTGSSAAVHRIAQRPVGESASADGQTKFAASRDAEYDDETL